MFSNHLAKLQNLVSISAMWRYNHVIIFLVDLSLGFFFSFNHITGFVIYRGFYLFLLSEFDMEHHGVERIVGSEKI